MGLKNFHIFFIMISVVTSLGFGLWCFFTEAGSALTGSKIFGSVSLAIAVALVIYGYKFLRKLDREGIE